ncbi:ABC transporter ATP-binding protein [Microbacterium esteraromaticum]|uniref:ABC transporter ATP-binding protein n=1 Tax=Microbacterium esteraromaticum TaxID=57043 RepID=UPI0026A73A6D
MLQLLTTTREVLRVMPRGASRYYGWYVFATASLAILDIISMSLLALVMGPILAGQEISIPILGSFSKESGVWFVLIACGLIIVKGLIAIGLHWRATRRFARYELEVGDRLLAAYTELRWDARARMKTSDVTRLADSGIANTTMGFLLPLASVPGNALSFVAVALVLVVAQPLGAVAVTAYLLLIAALLFFVISRKTLQAGRVNRDFAYLAAAVITELVDALKEVTLRNRLVDARQHVHNLRRHAVRARANISFLAIVPKYVIEAALVGGLLIVGTIAFIGGGLNGAVVAVALFGVVGFRMVPSLTGVQSSLTTASANLIYARNVIDDISAADHAASDRILPATRSLPDRPRTLRLTNLSYRYPDADRDVLHSIDLEISIGSSLGVAGPSGAGKSTLIDVLLGLLVPTQGHVELDGVPIDAAQTEYRSLVAYVPQSVSLIAGTFAQNVALTWGDDLDEERVERAMRRAQLGELIDAHPLGIGARVDERGGNLSGGQRQRLGIARALYSDPLILVMDEATSALDGRTESAVTDAIAALDGDVTVIAIAHRLATIRNLDRVAYMDAGRIIGVGSFEGLVADLPDFADQAQRAGLGGAL